MSNQEMREFCGCNSKWEGNFLPNSRDDAHVMANGPSKCTLCMKYKWYDSHYENKQWDKTMFRLDAFVDTVIDEILAEEDTQVQVTIEMIEAGNTMSEANIMYHLNGLGGVKTWEEWLKEDTPNKDLAIAYAKGKIKSVDAIYITMERAKVK